MSCNLLPTLPPPPPTEKIGGGGVAPSFLWKLPRDEVVNNRLRLLSFVSYSLSSFHYIHSMSSFNSIYKPNLCLHLHRVLLNLKKCKLPSPLWFVLFFHFSRQSNFHKVIRDVPCKPVLGPV